MKHIQMIVATFLFTSTFAQTKMVCCLPATDQFAMLASDKKFIAEHDAPLPFDYVSMKGEDITYKCADGTDAHAYAVKASTPTNVTIFVFQEWWGLNDYIKQEADKISADLGVNVIAPDLYDGKSTSDPNEAGKLVQSVKTERIQSIIKGAYAHVGSSAKIFTWGWCFGGAWSLQTALMGGKQVAGCVMYYGTPEKDVNRLKTLNCDVIAFFGKQDDHLTPAVAEQFKKDMAAAGKNISLYEYDAPHAFANPSNPKYNKEATADAYAKATAFVKQRM